MVAKCPPGMIRRKAYTRKGYTRLDGTKVKSTTVKSGCVKDMGKPGKTATKDKVLPKPVPGALSQYGYSNVKNTSAKTRRAALLKGVKDAGYATIVRRVNLISNYNKTSDPRVHEIMRSDIAWMQKILAPIYSKSASRKSSKKISKSNNKKSVVKAGIKNVGGKKRQLYHVSGSTKKFYRYRKKDGSYGSRYL